MTLPASAQPEPVETDGARPATSDGDRSELGDDVDLTRVSEHKLKNDLRITLQSIPGAADVTVCSAIRSGSSDDPRNAPGAYRVLAEILKLGGYRSEDQDYEALAIRRGLVSGVEVTREATTFCTTGPASELPLVLWVTAGRFTDGALTEPELARAVDHLAQLSEEEDARVISGRAPTRLRRMAFLGNDAWAHPTLPNPDDLDLLTLEQLRNLHEQSYVARRATVSVIGGVTEAQAVDQFPRQLYAAPTGEAAPERTVSLLDQSTMRFSMAEDDTAKTPAAWYGWVVPPGEDILAANATLSLLISDNRLKKTLISGYRAAKELTLHLDDPVQRGAPGFSRLEMVGSNSRSLGIIEKQFDTQLRALWTQGPSADELAQVQQRLWQERADRLSTAVGRAKELAVGTLFGHDAEAILAPLAGGESDLDLTPDRIKHAALRLLSESRRVIVEVYPKGWQDPWQSPMPTYHIVEKGHTLGSIAQRYGTSVAVITKMNGIDRNKPIYPGDKLKVPRGKVKKERKLRTHEVRRGDTLSGLGVKYGVSVRDIADANGMGSKQTIRTGETLRIPWPQKDDKSDSKGSSSSSSSGGSSKTHKVTSGETLSGIAHYHGVSTVALAQANGISHKAMVRVGQELKVPPRGTGKPNAPTYVTHKVKKGDTLSGIAQKHGVTVAELTVANNISRKAVLRLGQTLKIPKK